MYAIKETLAEFIKENCGHQTNSKSISWPYGRIRNYRNHPIIQLCSSCVVVGTMVTHIEHSIYH